jgi:hypothetical protein
MPSDKKRYASSHASFQGVIKYAWRHIVSILFEVYECSLGSSLWELFVKLPKEISQFPETVDPSSSLKESGSYTPL